MWLFVSGCACALLLVSVQWLSSEERSLEAAARLHSRLVLHQSVANAVNLSQSEHEWRDTWAQLGFTNFGSPIS